MDTSNWILKAPTTSKAQDMMNKIHVLLVDHDTNAHAPIVDMFEYFSYKGILNSYLYHIIYVCCVCGKMVALFSCSNIEFVPRSI